MTALYLLCFFYVLTYLTFTAIRGKLRYFVIPLWCLTMVLMVGGLLGLVFWTHGR